MRRVVVTGLGAVNPCGNDVLSSWKFILEGKSGIRQVTRFDTTDYPCTMAGECVDFPVDEYVEKKRQREGDKFIHYALAASMQAITQAGLHTLSDEDKERAGTIIGVGFCGLGVLEEVKETLMARGPKKVTPYFIPATISNLAPGQVSMRFGFKGPNYTTTSACASGAHAIGEAFRWIQRGDTDLMIAGGAESSNTPLGLSGFAAMRALSTQNHTPEKASRPFDKLRDGFVMGEGSGVLILEERERAMKRGATIHAEIVGYGTTSDAYHLTQPAPEGEGAQRAMRLCLKDGAINPGDVSYVNAHATSTPIGDKQELMAMKRVFGNHATSGALSISSTKGSTGHLLGAAGGIEAVFSVLALKDQVVPPTVNLEEVDEEGVGLDLTPQTPKQKPLHVAVSNSFGFGGTNVSLAFRKHA